MDSRAFPIYMVSGLLCVASIFVVAWSDFEPILNMIIMAAVFIIVIVTVVGVQIVKTLEHNALRMEQAIKLHTSALTGRS